MAKQANRMMIGGFVVFALFLLAASLAVFGSGKFFQRTQRFVMYFDGSVRGLSVGSPVLWEGVQIGSIVNIVIITDLAQAKMQIPVIAEILLDSFQVVRGEAGPEKNLERLINRGLRAMLATQSFITGQLAVEIGFFPDTPAVLRKSLYKGYQEYPEIPTIPSTTQRLLQALEKLDVKKIEEKLTSSLDGISKLVNNPDLAPSIQSLRETLQGVQKLIARVDGKVDPLTKTVKQTAKDFGRLANTLNSRVKEVTANFERTLSGLDKTMSGFDKTMTSVRGVVSPNAPMVVELENSLQEIAAMSRSIRELADYLEMYPETLLRGKQKPRGQ